MKLEYGLLDPTRTPIFDSVMAEMMIYGKVITAESCGWEIMQKVNQSVVLKPKEFYGTTFLRIK